MRQLVDLPETLTGQQEGGFRSTFGEYLGAMAGEGFWSTTTGQAWAQSRLARADAEGGAVLSQEEWRASPHFRERIPFDERMTAARAQALAEVHDENAYRRWLAGARDPGVLETIAGFGAAIVGGVPAAENFIPIAGPAWRAAQVARLGLRAGLAAEAAGGATAAAIRAAGGGVRGAATIGAAEAVGGNLLAMPLTYASRAEFGDDVKFADVVLDLTGAALIGAAFRGVPAAWRAMRDGDAPPLTLRQQQAAVNAAAHGASDLAAGRPVDIGRDQRARAEIAALGDAYDQVRGSPQGPAMDPLVRIEPDAIEATALARGGWKGLGDVEVQGAGWGLVKIIWKHGEGSRAAPEAQVTREDVLRLPEVIRTREAAVDEHGRRTWTVDTEDGRRLIYADKRFEEDGQRRVVTIHVDRDRKTPVSPERGPGSPADTFRASGGDTPQGGSSPVPASRATGNVAHDPRTGNWSSAPEPALDPAPARATGALPDELRAAHGLDESGKAPEVERALAELEAAGRKVDDPALTAARETLERAAKIREAFASAAACVIRG